MKGAPNRTVLTALVLLCVFGVLFVTLVPGCSSSSSLQERRAKQAPLELEVGGLGTRGYLARIPVTSRLTTRTGAVPGDKPVTHIYDVRDLIGTAPDY